MARILCPCNCGNRFEEIIPGGGRKKYFSLACGNKMRVRRWREDQKKKARKGQRALQFQAGKPVRERRKKNRVGEDRLFA
jgi:hypothetical protein